VLYAVIFTLLLELAAHPRPLQAQACVQVTFLWINKNTIWISQESCWWS